MVIDVCLESQKINVWREHWRRGNRRFLRMTRRQFLFVVDTRVKLLLSSCQNWYLA